MNKNIDVLSFLEEMANDGLTSRSRIRAARASTAIAELIEIATEFDGYIAADQGDTSLLDREDMWKRLSNALIGVKGDAA